MVLTGYNKLRHAEPMFERFTNLARQVIVRSQEEARGLHHNYIGTEHLLLGLLNVREGLAAQALDRFGMTPEGVREEVKSMIGIGKKPMSGHIPFTPRAKKTLELALREALELHHNYIGTEHLLLGVIREGEGVGAQILQRHAADLTAVRMAVVDLLQSATSRESRRSLARLMEARSGETGLGGDEPADLPTTPAAQTSLGEAARLAGRLPVGSHHLLLAALNDPNTAAARTLTSIGVDLHQAREALRQADVAGTSDELPEEAGRRQMRIRVTDDQVTVEATDQAIIDVGRAALEALGDQADPAGTIPGDLAASASLSEVWLALEQSLRDIRRRAQAGAGAPAPEAPEAEAPEAGAPAAGPSAPDKPAEPGAA
jgi:ATP-dependent Clp protease ATP-binding subunit ClpA